MKTTKIFKAVAFSALLLTGTTGAALAQDMLVSGEPYQGFFQGVTIPANGPIVTTRVAPGGFPRRWMDARHGSTSAPSTPPANPPARGRWSGWKSPSPGSVPQSLRAHSR